MFDIEVDIEPFRAVFDVLSDLEKGNESALRTFMEDMGGLIISEWANQAQVLRNPAGYIRELDESPQYPDEGNPLHIRVENHHKAAYYLEVGIDAFDLKKMLQTGHKIKVSKTGKRYIQIPFQHSKESIKQYGLSTEAEQLFATRRRNPTPQNPRTTEWGGRLKANNVGWRSKTFAVTGNLAKSMGQQTRKIQYTWKTSPFEGMVREEDKFKQTSGYFTFRTISDRSDKNSWIHPGIEGKHIAENTVQVVKPIILASFADTIQQAFNSIGQK